MAAIFEIVNEDYTLSVIPNSAGIGNPDAIKSAVTSKKNVSDKTAVCGKGVLHTTLEWSGLTSCTMPACTHVNGSGSISAGSAKTTVDGSAVLLKLDIGVCQGTFTNNSTGATIPCACQIIISDAGQTKVKAE